MARLDRRIAECDKGYDRMVTEMLAGDELCPEDQPSLRATGFLVRNYKMGSREQWLEDTLNHTCRAFLGVTMQCAKCQTNKFDPVTQEEYYRLRAVFEPHEVRTDPIPGVADKKKDGLCRVYDKELRPKTLFLHSRRRADADEKKGALTAGVPAALGGSLDVKGWGSPLMWRTRIGGSTCAALLAESTKALEERRAHNICLRERRRKASSAAAQRS